jgi:hypothetical protein
MGHKIVRLWLCSVYDRYFAPPPRGLVLGEWQAMGKVDCTVGDATVRVFCLVCARFS